MVSIGRALEELLENTLDLFRRAGFIVETIQYPMSKRSIDLVGTSGKSRVIAKITLDTANLSKIEVDDLKKASKAYNASPIIVSKHYDRKEIEPDVVVKKRGLNIVGLELLENYLLNKEKPLVFKMKGIYLVRVNPERFRERRLEKGYSIGQLADELGVTRKAVYDYEHGKLNVSVDVAIRIAELLGEDVFEPIDLLGESVSDEKVSLTVHDEIGEMLRRLCMRMGYRFYSLAKTPVDYVIKGSEISYSIVSGIRDTKYLRVKIREAYRITRTMNTVEIIVRNKNDLNEIKDAILKE